MEPSLSRGLKIIRISGILLFSIGSLQFFLWHSLCLLGRQNLGITFDSVSFGWDYLLGATAFGLFLALFWIYYRVSEYHKYGDPKEKMKFN